MKKPIYFGLAAARSLSLIIAVFALITVLGNLPDVEAQGGSLVKQINYDQTAPGVAVLDANTPHSFNISISSELFTSVVTSAQVSLPVTSPYLPNPITNFVYEVPFASISNLDAEFPDGTYTFSISENGTNFTPQVSFSSSVSYPASVPTLTNPNWSSDGYLILDPNNPMISWSGCSGDWSLGLSSADSGQGIGGYPCPSSFTPSSLESNTIYRATLSAFNTSSSVTVTDKSDNQNFTFYAQYGNVLHFSIITTGVTESCSYSVENYPPDWIFDENGGVGLIEIDASNSCCWSVVTPDNWIQIAPCCGLGQSSGCGSGEVAYTVQSVSSFDCGALPRTGTVYVDGHVFTVTQVQSQPCSVSISPTYQAVDPLGGSFFISVTDTSSCCWSVQNSNSWIYVSQSSGSYSTSIYCSVQPNTSGFTQTGAVVVGTQTLTVVQPSVCSNAPATSSNLIILQAWYGANGTSNNVLSIIQANVISNIVNMSINNSTMGGDPAEGYVKTLYILYQNDAGLFQQNVAEGGVLQIPDCLAQQLPPPQFLSANMSGGTFGMSFAAISNVSYTVQANLNLATTNWFNLTNFTGNGLVTPMTFSVSNGVRQEFFRVEQP